MYFNANNFVNVCKYLWYRTLFRTSICIFSSVFNMCYSDW